jgi:hypothetical protein
MPQISQIELGLPRLLERGPSAEFFVLAGLPGEPGRLNVADVRQLHEAGNDGGLATPIG